MYRRLRSFIKNNKGILLVIFLGLSLRGYLLNQGYDSDMITIAPWGRWIAEHGPLGFYSVGGWIKSDPTQPPLANLVYAGDYSLFQIINIIFVSVSSFIAINHLGAAHLTWWFNFVSWFGNTLYSGTNIQIGQLLTMKLTAVVADTFITIIIYKIGESVKSKFSVLAASIYFILPFSWYISSLWGQFDQLGFLFILLSLLLLEKRLFFISAILLFISIEIKPTSLIFIPLYSYLFLQRKPKLIEIISSISIIIILFLYTASLFTDKNLITFISTDLRDKIFLKSEYRLASESFNVWRLLIGSRLMDQDELILFIPGKYFSYLSFLLLNALAIWTAKKKDLFSVILSTFILGFGSWLFMNNMQERYIFSGVVLGIILLLFKPQLLRYIIAIALIFSLDLFYSWGYPAYLTPLRDALNWNGAILTRFFSALMLVIFIRLIILIKPFRLKLPFK